MREPETYEPLIDAAIAASQYMDLVLIRVRLLAYRRALRLRYLWSQWKEGYEDAVNPQLHSAIDGYLLDKDAPAAEAEWIKEAHSVKELNKLILRTEAALESDTASRLYQLRTAFGLDPLEQDLLHACAALAMDPSLAIVYAYLQDDNARGYVTESLVARLFGHGRYFLLPASSPLLTWGLVEASGMETTRYVCDPQILGWLLEKSSPDSYLDGISHRQEIREPLPGWPVEKAIRWIAEHMSDTGTHPTRLILKGPEGTGRKSFAAVVCHGLERPLLSIDCDRIPDTQWTRVFIHAQRFAYLNHWSLAWYGQSVAERSWPFFSKGAAFQFIIADIDQHILPQDPYLDQVIQLPDLTLQERAALWPVYLPQITQWDKTAADNLIVSRRVTIGQLNALRHLKPASIGEAYDFLNLSNERRLGSLAHRVDCTFVWDDLIVPEQVSKALKEFSFEATERTRFWEDAAIRRLFPLGRGLIALFTGNPGTGKTMAAQVLAATLQLELYRIDLSVLVSKYIGETSKNIERILSRAQRMDVLLFFDEADALFGKRTEPKDAHDRYANTDTNYLLQAIEEYPGVSILASNKKGNLDPAFTRRIRYVLDFPKPTPGQRLQIWRRLVEGFSGTPARQRLDRDLEQLSAFSDVTGAQIKGAVLTAAFIARHEQKEIGIAHLLGGLERELLKEGRALGRIAQEVFKLSPI